MKPIKKYNEYLIGVDGRLFSLKSMSYLKPYYDKDGYVIYRLSIGYYSKLRKAHRLVAETYIPNDDSKLEVNHLDGNKKNNMLCNLKWVTKSENAKHAWATGLQKKNLEQRGKLVLDMETGIYYKSCKEAAEAKGMKYDLLKHRLRGRTINNTKLKYV